MTMWTSYGVVSAACLLVLTASLCYFRRYQVARPAIGVMTGADLAVIGLAVVLMPAVYLNLPRWASPLVMVPTGFGIVYVSLQPIIVDRRAILAGSSLLVGADLVVAAVCGSDDPRFFAINDAVLLVMVVGVSNLWAQSGMKPPHLVALAGVLMVYDFLATSQTRLMGDLQQRVGHGPLAPFVTWAVGGRDLSLGFGDLLLAATFILVVRRSYGRAASFTAWCVVSGGMMFGLALISLQIVHRLLPAMVVLAPLMTIHWATLRARGGAGRKTHEYLREEPVRGRRPTATGSALIVRTDAGRR